MTSIEKRMTDGTVRYACAIDPERRVTAQEAFARKVDAERFKTKIDNAKDTGVYVDPARSRVTVGSWSDQWLDAQTDLSPPPATDTRASLPGTSSRVGGTSS